MRFRSSHVLAATIVGLFVGLGASIPLARGDAKASTIGVDEIKDGMKGYGLTVFKGTEPEKFDVEVIGTLHNFRPGQDLILVKTIHPRLAITKNVKGMSGSPIYFDGRLAGAYAYSLASFMTEAVAGITPINTMLSELHRPIPPGFWPLQHRAPLPNGVAPKTAPQKHAALDGPTRWSGTPGQYDLFEHSREVGNRLGMHDPNGVVPAATPLLMSGMGEHAFAFAKKIFEPLGLEPLAGGGGHSPAQPGDPKHFVDGGSLGVQLAYGDVSMMGLGTVTHVEGTKLAGFGHPMMEAGDTALPTTLARVLWIYASDNHSFKVGEGTTPLGALVQDRQSAVVADETAVAPTFPVHIDVVGADSAPKKTWNMTVADERFMSPGLVASMLGSVIEATVQERRDVTWQLHSKVAFQNHGTLEFDDFGIADGGMPEGSEWGASRAVRAIGDVLNNPWENASVTGYSATLTVNYTRDLWRIRGVEAGVSEIDAGDKARLVVHLEPFSGPAVTRTLEVTIPKSLAGKDVELEVLPGYDVAPEQATPENLNELLANEPRQSLPPKSLVVQYKLPSQGVAFGGHVAQDLPDFALSALRPSTATVAPEAFTSYARTVVPVDRYVEGRDKVKIKVRQPAQ
ncbi:MAG TPA: hypothetical protein VF407_06485 [Polyangiaceae bacterium]